MHYALFLTNKKRNMQLKQNELGTNLQHGCLIWTKRCIWLKLYRKSFLVGHCMNLSILIFKNNKSTSCIRFLVSGHNWDKSRAFNSILRVCGQFGNTCIFSKLTLLNAKWLLNFLLRVSFQYSTHFTILIESNKRGEHFGGFENSVKQ